MFHIENTVAKTHLAQQTRELRACIKYFDMNNFLYGPTAAVAIYPRRMIGLPKWLYPLPEKDLVVPLVHPKHLDTSHPHYTSTDAAEPLFWISSKKKILVKQNGTYYHIPISKMRDWVYEQEAKDLLDVVHENMVIPVTVTIREAPNH